MRFDKFPPFTPSELEPCPVCKGNVIFIKAGINKQTMQSYEAYYKCPNNCVVEGKGQKYKFWFWARVANKHLKSITQK